MGEGYAGFRSEPYTIADLGVDVSEAVVHVPEVLGEGKPPVEALGHAHAPHHHHGTHETLAGVSALGRVQPPGHPGLAEQAA